MEIGVEVIIYEITGDEFRRNTICRRNNVVI